MKEIAPRLFLIAAIAAGLDGPFASWKIAKRRVPASLDAGDKQIPELLRRAQTESKNGCDEGQKRPSEIDGAVLELPDFFYPVIPRYW